MLRVGMRLNLHFVFCTLHFVLSLNEDFIRRELWLPGIGPSATNAVAFARHIRELVVFCDWPRQSPLSNELNTHVPDLSRVQAIGAG